MPLPFLKAPPSPPYTPPLENPHLPYTRQVVYSCRRLLVTESVPGYNMYVRFLHPKEYVWYVGVNQAYSRGSVVLISLETHNP